MGSLEIKDLLNWPEDDIAAPLDGGRILLAGNVDIVKASCEVVGGCDVEAAVVSWCVRDARSKVASNCITF